MNLETLRKLLGNCADNYSEDELIEIRRDLYQLAELALDLLKKKPHIFIEKQKQKFISQANGLNTKNDKSHKYTHCKITNIC